MKSWKNATAAALALCLCLCLAACEKGGGSGVPSDGSLPAASEPAASRPGESSRPTFPGLDASRIDMSVPEGYRPGDRMPDFTLKNRDGREYSLYETLMTKDVVLIHFWTPKSTVSLEELERLSTPYEAHRDSAEIFALCSDKSSSDDYIAKYGDSLGLSFPVRWDRTGLFERFGGGLPPVMVVVDRFGVICLVDIAAQGRSEGYEHVLGLFSGEDYTESLILERMPGAAPEGEAPDPETLAGALNVPALSFTSPAAPTEWPMHVINKNGRSYVSSTNKYKGNTVCSVGFTLTVNAGDALLFDYMVSSEEGRDLLTLYKDGRAVKCLSGEVGEWTTGGYEFTQAGTYSMAFAYEKDGQNDGGSDFGALDEVRLVPAGPTARRW